MKHTMTRLVATVLALLMMCAVLTACGDDNPVVIYDSNTDVTEPETEETQPIPEGRLGMSYLMAVMGPTMAWSDLSEYEHTDVSDTEAVFLVQNNKGQTCELTVTYDAAADTISSGVLQCGDVEEDIMSGETAAIRRILVAMNQQEQP